MIRSFLYAAGIAAISATAIPSHGSQALAQAQQLSKNPQPCGLGLVHNGPMLHRAAFQVADVPAGSVRLTFAGHSSFLIETTQGVKAVTDYNDFVRPPGLPDLVTMNTGHSTHSTDSPDPAIKYVLRGWKEEGGIQRHHMRYKDMRVYNLPTNIEGQGFSFFNNSSIFVFEAAGVCIAHFGNLRHALDEKTVAGVGRVDVMLVAADRRITNSIEEVLHNIALLKPRLVVPMHCNFVGNAMEFGEQVKHLYPVKIQKGAVLEASRATLPQKTEVLIIPGLGMEPPGDPL
ncbi:MAG: MBL fold metallo-hydrolase [Proteobacteria bacterium]|nr:MBL fold metallo-hydrolase [Pseudomonadota bacterium]